MEVERDDTCHTENLDDICLNDRKLREGVERMDRKVVEFCTAQRKIADALGLTGERQLEEDKENARQKKEEIEQDMARAEEIEQEMRGDKAELEEGRRELERKSTQEGLLPPEQQRLQRTLEQQQQILLQRDSGLQQAQHQKDQRLNELQRGCDTYRNMLGLDFDRVGDERLQLIFTQIDERNPKRVFTFQVFVDPNDHYHIERCEPMVPNVEHLVDALNTSNDFSAFVRKMRREFKLLAQ